MIRIATCDDSDIQREILGELLSVYNYEGEQLDITPYSSPAELLDQIAKDQSYDIYILDQLMPEMTGIELAGVLRNLADKATIIFLSSSPEYVFQSFEVDAFHYLIKPVEPEKLYSVLDKAIAHHLEEQLQHKKASDDLIAHISHEIRTPLSVISGYAQRIQLKLRNQPQTDAMDDVSNSLRTINDETQRLGSLVTQIAENAVRKDGHIELTPYSVHRSELTAACDPILAQNGNHLTLSILDSVPPILCNQYVLIQLMKNLMQFINNHFKDSEIRMEISASSSSACAQMKILPYGKDLMEQSLAKTLQSGWSTAGCIALGLNVCKDMVELMHGKMVLEEAAQTSCIVLSFPKA